MSDLDTHPKASATWTSKENRPANGLTSTFVRDHVPSEATPITSPSLPRATDPPTNGILAPAGNPGKIPPTRRWQGCEQRENRSSRIPRMAELRTLNPRVRGSSPWRRTRSRPQLMTVSWGFAFWILWWLNLLTPRQGSGPGLDQGPPDPRFAGLRCSATARRLIPVVAAASAGRDSSGFRSAWTCGFTAARARFQRIAVRWSGRRRSTSRDRRTVYGPPSTGSASCCGGVGVVWTRGGDSGLHGGRGG
jgi:hypothetical protein